MMIRVILVDDHILLRQGTHALLNNAVDIDVIAESSYGDEALTLVRKLNPDVVVLDIRLQGMSGVDVARILRQDFPHIKVLILSAYNSEQYVRGLFAIGVHGYLLKNASATELIVAVRSVYQGETVISGEVSAQLVNQKCQSGIGATFVLSYREREILELVSQGATNKEIATRLNISSRTVETHVANAMAKLGARSRTEAMSVALQRGLLTLE